MKRLYESFRPAVWMMALCAGLLLAGCESAAEKAERYYQSAMALLAEGDEDRALVELLNVFRLDEFHKQARLAYGEIMLEQGRPQEAYGHYLRLAERYPGMADVRIILAEMALQGGDWTEAERHGVAALDLVPDDPRARAVGLVLAYRDATLREDSAERARIAEEARVLLGEQRALERPDNDGLVRIVIDDLDGSDPDAALEALEVALAHDPEALDLNMMKVRLLAEAGEIEATGAHLLRMNAVFPNNRDIQLALVNWYMMQKDVDGAEAFLRTQAGDDTSEPEGHLSLVRLLQAVRGTEAARDELTRLRAANEGTANGRLYAALLATMDFDAGRTEEGIAAMRAALDGAEPGEQTRRLQVMFARMLERDGAHPAAREIVKNVLAEDAGHAPALRLRAEWLIDADKPAEAVSTLRPALSRAPRDIETLRLMATAHERNGDVRLAGERLATAFEVAKAAPADALRYAGHLVRQGHEHDATQVLEQARERAPLSLDVLLPLADIRLRARAWPKVQDIVETLRQIDTDASRQAALNLQAAILQGQDRTDDSLDLLRAEVGDDVSEEDRQAARSVMLIVQTHVAIGKPDAARAYLDEVLERSPDNPILQLLDAHLYALMGRMKQAEDGYRALMERFPHSDLPARLLLGVLSSAGRQEDRRVVLDRALQRMPESASLRWYKAGMLEREGDIDGAIAVYEDLYARDSGNMVIANNLASLLSTRRNVPGSVERAHDIARRLRSSDVPAFQDTYGWISYLRGNFVAALSHLEPAAAALPDDAMVQYHLGMVYARLGRDGDARVALRRALALANDDMLPRLHDARETLDALVQPPEAAEPEAPSD